MWSLASNAVRGWMSNTRGVSSSGCDPVSPGGLSCSASSSSCQSPRRPNETLDEAVQRLSRVVTLPATREVKPRQVQPVGVVGALPTEEGPMHVRGYHDPVVGDILAVVFGDVSGREAVPLRVHDQCQTSEVFRSRKCDCAQQLHSTLRLFRNAGVGVLLYMPQEGRGIGLANKLAAYELQERFGCDTVDANTLLGLPEENRDYGGVPSLLADLGVQSVRLVTNNPYKISELRRLGVEVDSRESAVFCEPHPEAAAYLKVKGERMGHSIQHPARSEDSIEGLGNAGGCGCGACGDEGESIHQAVERLRASVVAETLTGAGQPATPREVSCVGVVGALPTEEGPMHVRGYHDPVVGDIMAVVFGDVAGREAVPLRVHDQCQTSEVFRSRKCDCAQQLHSTLRLFRNAGVGVLLYMPQEGRGIGLANKLAAYELQERFGCDTVDANTLLGLPEENRDYGGVPSLLADLGVQSVRLVTNNPYKISELRRLGVKVGSRDRAVFQAPHAESIRYLQTKERRMGHAIRDGAPLLEAGGESPASPATAAVPAEYHPSRRARLAACAAAQEQMAQAAVRRHRGNGPVLILGSLNAPPAPPTNSAIKEPA
eukprot:Hpha_TRINITY_DN12999_c0_g2::TRINITY_DN12999_c0_g2_i1::g.164334::m.164334/K14652/ribBA; 3,4-dihydroxy 2-butanone 4-phosphate synthase / GTP cyclohydrolase II